MCYNVNIKNAYIMEKEAKGAAEMTGGLLDVLIVDDELPLREELRLFDWEAHGFRLAGEADNGERALEFCRGQAPDIVITDITMPKMDGITLFRRLRQEGIATQVILLTCHSEFGYAREALQLGAVEYLIKVEMDDPDIIRALAKAREAHDRQRLLSHKEAERKRWELSKTLARGSAGKAGEQAEFLPMLKQLYGLEPPLYLSALHVELKRDIRLPGLREVEECLGELEQSGLPFRWATAREGVYLLISGGNAMQIHSASSTEESGGRAHGSTLYPVQEREGLLRLTDSLEKELSYLNGAMRIYAVTAPGLVNTEQEAWVRFRLLAAKPSNAFYEPEQRIFCGSQDNGRGLGESLVMLEKLASTLPDAERLAAFVREELGKWAAGNRIHPEALQGWASLHLRQRRENSNGKDQETDSAKAAAEAGSIDELTAVLLHALEPAEASKGMKRKLRKEIADAQSYIQGHLNQSLTLASVAEQVGFSSHYLSRLFRMETGGSFNDYVTRQRMEKAIELLQNTTMRVYEVGHAVGIPSYRYFSATFRQYTGVSPTFYKKG